ncbi:phage tail protein [Flavobacterium sharifuzzamanii]|uniref:phage tail protein n=1 Tax=Flavobacterium sharifuzzamanii TaxID=2211133 RepID=UPI00193E76D7|nr:tail fiber protein [Flavobacterium sharifuzzamanii]
MEGYLGEIRLYGGNFAPRGWALCNGTTLSIANYDALYALIGTIYGGDGINTFKIPDLQGRVPVGAGTGQGLPNIALGQASGTENVTMTINQMPAHNHVATGSLAIPADNAAGELASPTGNILAGLAEAYSTAAPDTDLKTENATVSFQSAGSTVPFSIIQPYLTTNYIICIEGIFPSRN